MFKWKWTLVNIFLVKKRNNEKSRLTRQQHLGVRLSVGPCVTAQVMCPGSQPCLWAGSVCGSKGEGSVA